MKSKKNYNIKFLKLELINLKIFNNSSMVSFSEREVTEFIVFLKKAFTIVYKYHINQKRILIIGISQYYQFQVNHLLKRTKHTFLSEYFYDKGLITNKLTNRSILLQNSYDLILILNPEKHNILIKETLKYQIPVVCFKKHNIHNYVNSYNVPSELLRLDFIKIKIFLLFLKSIIKKF